ncbi:hypothetical protein GUJ93_ZPchr0004g40485 [Zizania palustris]|uniref:Uncharacterized protein n=1 Tax=Zizania palustris TaxID=103762 RepID=A0A8J5SKL6_ZIZPA|nr:hypothetical protein GUJ93_ZPchr0004g40485 [Zizania palustris]
MCFKAISALHGETDLVDGGASSFTADMVEASHDTSKLQRLLVAGGIVKAAVALYLVLYKSPAGLFLRSKGLFYSYYGGLSAVIVFGVVEAWIGLWVSHNCRRRAVGMTVLWLSILPQFFLAGVAGSTILK